MISEELIKSRSSENVSITTIPLENARVVAQASAPSSDPINLIRNSTWLLADNSLGYWTATVDFDFTPTTLRLWNTEFEGRGTKSFHINAWPVGSIMNFSYTGPEGQKGLCDRSCPLPEGNTTMQTFSFINQVSMNSFRLDIVDWYGIGAGLQGIELIGEVSESASSPSATAPSTTLPSTISRASSLTSSPPTASSTARTESLTSSSEALSTAAIIGIVVGGVFATALIALILWFISRRQRKETKSATKAGTAEEFRPTGGRHELGVLGSDKKEDNELEGNEIHEMEGMTAELEDSRNACHELPEGRSSSER